MKTRNTRRRARPISTPYTLVAALALPSTLFFTTQHCRAATTDNWTAASGNWSLNTNWTNASNGHTVPAAGDTVNILETDGANRTISYDYTGAAITLNSLTLNLTGNITNNTTLSMAANTLTATLESIGNSGAGSNGTGFFNQSGGSNNPTNLTLAQNPTDTGYYTLSAGNLSVGSGNEAIGSNGTAIFNHTGGTNSASVLLYIGLNASSNATYNLSNTGLITIGNNQYVGFAGKGTLNQTGGTNNVTTSIGIAESPVAVGNYNLSGGSVTTGSVFVGGFFGASGGNGTLTMNGGNMTVSSTLKIWNANSNVNFSGGNLSVGTLDTNGNSANFNWTAGNLTLTSGSLVVGSNTGVAAPLGNSLSLGFNQNLTVLGQEIVGYTGNGSLAQNGGNNSATRLDLAEQPGSNANYTFSSGTLSFSTGTSVWGYFGNATFTQSGGFTSAQTIDLGEVVGYGNGTLNLNANSGFAPSFNATRIFVGGNNSGPAGVGTLNISQGTMTLSTLLDIWSTGSVNLSNGTLSVASLITNGAPANLNWTGGTLAFTGNALTVDSNGPLGPSLLLHTGMTLSSINGVNNNGSITLNGGIITGTGPLINNSLLTGFGTISGSGGFTNNVLLSVSGGPLAITATGAISNPGTITLSAGGQLQISGATLTNPGTINLNSSVIAGTAALNNAGGTIVGPGTLLVSLTQSGTIIIPTGTTTLTFPLTNNGLISLTGLGATLFAPTITNANTIQGAGAINAIINNTTGTVESSGGTLVFNATVLTGGTLAVDNNSKMLVSSGIGNNSGIISLTGGTFDNAGHSLNNTGQITGYGVIRTGGLTNNGSFTLTGTNGSTTTVNGDVTNSAAQSINIKFNPAIFTGNITNNGIIKTTSTTVTFTGNYTGSTYISDPATNIFQANATTIPGGLMTGFTGDAFLFNTFTNNGTFQNGGNLSVTTSITNAATFSQSGPQYWSPGATFTNTAGLATFSSNAKLYGLTITAGAVDITTSKFIIEATANKSAALATLQQNIATHALTSSTLPANYALALIDNALLNKTSFGGNPADANSLLLSPELLGDTNIDGTVNLTDLTSLLSHFGATTSAWTSGNFDNQPTIDLTDLAYLLNNFGLTNPNNAAPTLSPSQVTAAPEVSALALLTSGTFVFLARRKRS